jgi:hypothetical protein
MRSNNSAIKKQKADKRAKKKKEKFLQRMEKKSVPKRDFDSMIAYVDKYGNITSEPVVENEPPKDLKEQGSPQE